MSGQGTFGKSPKVRNNRVIWTVNYIDYINLQNNDFLRKCSNKQNWFWQIYYPFKMFNHKKKMKKIKMCRLIL